MFKLYSLKELAIESLPGTLSFKDNVLWYSFDLQKSYNLPKIILKQISEFHREKVISIATANNWYCDIYAVCEIYWREITCTLSDNHVIHLCLTCAGHSRFDNRKMQIYTDERKLIQEVISQKLSYCYTCGYALYSATLG